MCNNNVMLELIIVVSFNCGVCLGCTADCVSVRGGCLWYTYCDYNLSISGS